MNRRSSLVSRFIDSKSRYAVGINAFKNAGSAKGRRKHFPQDAKSEGFSYPDGCLSLSSLYLRILRFNFYGASFRGWPLFMMHEYFNYVCDIKKIINIFFVTNST